MFGHPKARKAHLCLWVSFGIAVGTPKAPQKVGAPGEFTPITGLP